MRILSQFLSNTISEKFAAINGAITYYAFIDMIFDEDAILISLFERYTDEDDLSELSKSLLKYSKGSAIENNRPQAIDTPKVDPDDIDAVNYLVM